MTVFLMILKMIGIILLVPLCTLIVLVLLILFVPVRYEARAVSEDKVSVSASVTWLLHLVRFCAGYQDERSMKLFVLCFPIRFGRKKPKKEKENPGEPATEPTAPETSEHTASGEEYTDENAKESAPPEPKRKENKEAAPGKGNPIRRVKRIFASILDKIKHIDETAQKGKAMLTDSHNKAAFSHIKREAFLLLKRICPRKLKADVSYSTGSPDTTAWVFGILAMFPAGYQNRWKIYPDFEADSLYVKGTVFLKGKIYIYQVMFAALRLVLDKNCRRFIKKIID